MRPAFAFFISMSALASQATAGPFDAAPSKYAETVNPALQQVGSDLRVRQAACVAARCRFAARQVEIEVSGPADRPVTERITVAASFRQGDAAAATGLFEDALTVVGATMVAYDPGMAAERRGEVLFELGEAALGMGEAHLDSADVHYAVSFDDVSGRLEITAATLRAGHG
jgi:hypothetical protein